MLIMSAATPVYYRSITYQCLDLHTRTFQASRKRCAKAMLLRCPASACILGSSMFPDIPLDTSRTMAMDYCSAATHYFHAVAEDYSKALPNRCTHRSRNLPPCL